MANQIQKWDIQYKNGISNTKMAQAIFLPGAWGKIPDFMGKNHPTPGAAMVFSHAQKYPLFARLKKFLKKVLYSVLRYGNLLALIKTG